jgi:hypothetical protein
VLVVVLVLERAENTPVATGVALTAADPAPVSFERTGKDTSDVIQQKWCGIGVNRESIRPASRFQSGLQR